MTFVPEAFDATFWSASEEVVSLSDNADCIAVLADAGLLEVLTNRFAPSRCCLHEFPSPKALQLGCDSC